MKAAAIDRAGRAGGAAFWPTPHCDARPPGCEIELGVIHGISLPPGCFGGDAVARFFRGVLDCDADRRFAPLRGLRVSAHFYIDRAGRLAQFAPCDLRAWHAGESRYRGRGRCNDFSVGIELEGADETPYADAQYETLIALARGLIARYPTLGAFAGHCHIAPRRKTDPGPSFDWGRFFAAVGESYDGRRDAGA